MVAMNGDWIWSRFEHLLPMVVLLSIATIKALICSAQADSLGWFPSLDRSFLVLSLAWRIVIRRDYWAVFCTMSFKECLGFNLVNSTFATSNREEWPQLFGFVLWSLWKHRNMLIFYQETANSEPIFVDARRLAHDCRDVRSLSVGRNIHSRSQHCPRAEVRWKCPDTGWFKVNSDGARCLADGRTACGAR
ncbi:hypothetical protein V6N11_033819 [Hibiscus sabdariffa]|uniref:Uncharacterized protein n=1 Tax=Hibiscus sabdariffa TaxID=183260 RepID=A0ABR2S1F9_9ROSI